MRSNWTRMLLTALLPSLLTSAGCDDFSKKDVGMVVVYEIVPDDDSPDAKPSESDIDKTVAALQRRLSPGGVELGGVRKLPDGRVEARIYWAKPKRMEGLAATLPRPGTVEFRILANRHDHKALIDRAEAEPDSNELLDADGKREAWWVPVQAEAEKGVTGDKQVATRTRKKEDCEVTEVLVVKDPYDVTGDYLQEARASVDERDQPCVDVEFDSMGGRLLGGLTGNHLPDSTTGLERRLGIILDGELVVAPGIRSTIRSRCQITGGSTKEEMQDWVDLLNAGSLPLPIREVSRRKVAPGEELPE